MANPNPSPETRFKKGNVANPSGRSKKEQKATMKAAAISAQLRLKALSGLMETIGDRKLTAEDLELLINPAALKLFKDSEDRMHGTPKQSVEQSGPDGGPIAVTEVRYKIHDPLSPPDED